MIRELRTAAGWPGRLPRRGQRGRGGQVLRLEPGRAGRRARPGGRRLRGRDVRGQRGRHLRARAGRCCSAGPTRWTRSGSPPSGGRWRRPGSSGSGRAGTTRWWRPGTVWPSRPWPRPACCWAGTTCRGGHGQRHPAGRRAPVRRPAGPQLARRDGRARAGVLEDYADVAEGFLVLSGVTGDARWVTLAGQLLDTVLTSFGDGPGGFYDTAADAEQLIYRPADPADNATPSGTFAAAGALLSYAALTGSARHRDAALSALGVLPVLASRYPRAAGWGLAVAEACCPDRPRSPWSARPEPRPPGPCCGPRWRPRRRARCWPSATGRSRGPAAGGPGPGRRPGRGLRLPQLRLPAAGHRPGRPARRPHPSLTDPA